MTEYHVKVKMIPTKFTADQSAFFQFEQVVKAEREGIAKSIAMLNSPYQADGHHCEFEVRELDHC